MHKVNIVYNKRTKTYRFMYPNIAKAIKVLGSKNKTYLYVLKVIGVLNNGKYTVPEFFLLELEFILNDVINNIETVDASITSILMFIDVYKEMLEYIRTETWVSERYTKNKHPLNLARIRQVMRYEPLPHQIEIMERYEYIKTMANIRGYELDMSPGTGKTFTSLAIGEGLNYNKFLIISPKQVIENVWYDGITKELYNTPQSVCMLGSKDKECHNEKFILTHYEYLLKLVRNNTLLTKLQRIKPIIIVDEFHNFNEIKSKRTQALLSIINKISPKDVLLLTGTPVKFDVKELVPMLYVLDSKFPPVIDQFKALYKGFNNPIISDLLHYRFGLYRKRIEKEDNMLPPLKIEDYKIKLPKDITKKYLLDTIYKDVMDYKEKRMKELMDNYKQYEQQFYMYMNMVKEKLAKEGKSNIINEYYGLIKIIHDAADKNHLQFYIEELQRVKEIEKTYIEPNLPSMTDVKIFRNIAPIIKYPQLKVMGEALGRIVLGRRIECYNDLAKHVNYQEVTALTNKKTLIFSNYVSVCINAIDKAKKDGMHPLGIFGQYTKELDSRVAIFKQNPNINPLVATYKSLSTGVQLTVANIVLCLDIPFRHYLFDQAISRVHRIPQDKPVIVLLAKLDSDDEYNITDRDMFILKLSEMRVKLITQNKTGYDIPESKLNKKEEEVLRSELVSSMVNDSTIPNFIKNVVESIKEKIFVI